MDSDRRVTKILLLVLEVVPTVPERTGPGTKREVELEEGQTGRR